MIQKSLKQNRSTDGENARNIQKRPRRTEEQQVNNTITEMKNTLEGINSRITKAEEWISEVKERMLEIIAKKQNEEKRMKKTEDSLKDFWDTKHTNL